MTLATRTRSGAFAIAVAVGGALALAGRTRFLRWGATNEEIADSQPGDDPRPASCHGRAPGWDAGIAVATRSARPHHFLNYFERIGDRKSPLGETHTQPISLAGHWRDRRPPASLGLTG
jgi:hypothetical protein